MTIASSNSQKIGVGETKEKYQSHTRSSTSKKATSALTYLKNYFGFDSTKNMRLRFLTLTPQPWLKPKQFI